MKKFLNGIGFVLVCMGFAATVQAQVSPDGNWEYEVDAGDTITITEYLGNGGNVTVPVKLPKDPTAPISILCPVTAIGNFAFSDCSSLTRVTIPFSVTHIETNPFSRCTALIAISVDESNVSYSNQDGVLFNKAFTELIAYPAGKEGTDYSIPGNVGTIKGSAFSGCSRLTRVTIPTSVTCIKSSAFSYCSRLTNVTIPTSVTWLGSFAFFSCSRLTSVTIPDSVALIDSQTFMNCISLTRVTIPDSVMSIGSYAFRGCSGLTSVTIPEGVTSIGSWNPFAGCSSLSVISVEASNTAYSSEDGVLFDKAFTRLIAYPPARAGTGYSIPGSVTSIEGAAFEDCISLTRVTIPGSVTSIAVWAFDGCSSLTRALFLGDAPGEFGSNVFDDCADNFTVFHRPGKTGFETICSTYPCALMTTQAGIDVLLLTE
ncbi:MAG: hypothetical protein CSA22_07935 [Deltaproteobacteria bacterium]|nr:MAG: hypothetical protein CSA22_07935 [Deltaproteobacteria bacterium]